jgi:hypothetical protein
MFRYDEAVAGNFHKKDTAHGWQPPLRLSFRKPSAFLKPKVPVMASRSLWDFYPFYLGRFTNLMLTVMPVLFAIFSGFAT